ncbi:MAG: hypothetical protein GY719_25840 [bacterium]|nr:hypothetical protein [bacterium]
MQRKTLALVVLALVVTGCASGPLVKVTPPPLTQSVTPTTPWICEFTEAAIDNDDSEWYHLHGDYSCFIWGTWDSATAGLETLVSGTRDTPTKLQDVAPSTLKGLTADMPDFAKLIAGKGSYRLAVSGGGGSVSLSLQCRCLG